MRVEKNINIVVLPSETEKETAAHGILLSHLDIQHHLHLLHHLVYHSTHSCLIMHLLALASLLPLALAAPVIQPRGPGVQLIPDSYIVKFKDGTSNTAVRGALDGLKSVKAKHVFGGGKFKGFAAKLDSKSIGALKKLSQVCSPLLTTGWMRRLTRCAARLTTLSKTPSSPSTSLPSRPMLLGVLPASRPVLPERRRTSTMTVPAQVPAHMSSTRVSMSTTL